MKSTLALSILSLALSTGVFAGTPSAKAPTAPVEEVRRAITYDYVEGGYTGLFLDNGPNFNGGYLEGSFSPINNVFLFGRVGGYGGDDSLWDVSAGVGLYVPLLPSNQTPTIDFTLRTGWNFSSYDGGDDINAWFIAPGFRILTCKKFEVNVQGFYFLTDEDEDGDGIALGGGAVYYLNDHIALTANYSYDFDAESHFVQSGLRYMW
jgi:opacity protein-like surface antigen